MSNSGIFSKDYRKIVNKIKELRLQKCLTQLEFAKKLNKTQSYVSKIESGQVRVDILQLKEISKILDKDINYFI